MPPNLRIELVQAAPNQDYYPGGTVSGNLLLDVDEPKSYKQILVQFVGRSYVHWTESCGDEDGETTETYTSSEAYVDLTTIAWNSQQAPDGNLPPGQYSWPFSFNIPPTAPSSFDGNVGNIRYSLVATIVTGMLKFNHNVEVRIPVLQLVKITDQRLLQPVRQEVQKTVCCLCCASPPIVLSVAAPKTGFCVGESFPLHVSLENGSSRRVNITATIVQHVRYYAQAHHRHSSNTLSALRSDEIEPHATQDWDPTVVIPTSGVDIIHDSSCRNINVFYSLKVNCDIPGSIDLAVNIPIQLGNCRDEQGQFQSVAAAYPPPNIPAFPANQPPVNYVPPPANGVAFQPPPVVGSGSGAVGWVTEPGPGFPPPTKPQETLADISAPLATEKTPLIKK
jgi:hypothetical protein